MLPRVVVAPEFALAVCGFTLAGIALGTLSGLVPGLHANNVALLLAAGAAAAPGPPTLVACAMLAAGVVHTFLDVVPALALGVPDPAMAASALPGHRLVVEGRGEEALRLSALGSVLAVALAVPLAVPITMAMTRLYPVVTANLSLVLGGIALAMVLTEPTWPRRAGATLAVGASAALGLLTLDLAVSGPLGGSTLMPLFAGLFGVPVLLDAMGGAGVPEQDDARLALSRRSVAGLGGVGTLSGAAVGYLPGVSSAVAATLALTAVPGRYGARGFVVATSGVNTANTVFALFALFALGTPRTGVLVAVDDTVSAPSLTLSVLAVAGAALAGFVLVGALGPAYLRFVGDLDPTRLSVAVLALLCVFAFLFAGGVGVGLLVAAGVVGLLPPRLGVKRAHLMGVLVGPLAL
ncbi:tripartite tricarboxylate transporter permease [Halomarina rubra]|uniref:Tripartite tricarboxylate transporter permease n=1 Tax=Halomarina rubra TaxID=2071873 RepID=A0ABD6ARV5_9EURY|nr:tripartite tricarboxylate transporter permease [Halomarina rubra]